MDAGALEAENKLKGGQEADVKASTGSGSTPMISDIQSRDINRDHRYYRFGTFVKDEQAGRIFYEWIKFYTNLTRCADTHISLHSSLLLHDQRGACAVSLR